MACDLSFATEHRRAACATATLTDTDRARLRAYVHALPAAFGVSAANMVILRDSERDRRILYGDRVPWADCLDRDRLALGYLLDVARREDMKVIDLVPLFRLQMSSIANAWTTRQQTITGMYAAMKLQLKLC